MIPMEQARNAILLTLFLMAEVTFFVLALNESTRRSFVRPLQMVFTQLRVNAVSILAALGPKEVRTPPP